MYVLSQLCTFLNEQKIVLSIRNEACSMFTHTTFIDKVFIYVIVITHSYRDHYVKFYANYNQNIRVNSIFFQIFIVCSLNN